MTLAKRLTPILSLLVLALALPAAYGAGSSTSQSSTELSANQVQISQFEQSSDGENFTPGSNISVAEGSDVHFRLGMNALAAGTYAVRIEYTDSLTKGGVTALGYTGVAIQGVSGAANVKE
ncbi:MAG: hypothetical protein R3320_05320, partial [Nitriliruptorales bacterium]|nr:hypothetical protein [Nitriliruptorales bacterium]